LRNNCVCTRRKFPMYKEKIWIQQENSYKINFPATKKKMRYENENIQPIVLEATQIWRELTPHYFPANCFGGSSDLVGTGST
jgi:hypothetical protein